jgi:hypothetical protein
MQSEIRSLYRSFLKLQKLWPAQPHRRVEFKQVLLEEVRARFRKSPVDDLAQALAKGRQELQSMESLLVNKVEKKVYLEPLKIYGN